MQRCAIVPPVPVPYREELFARLAAREDLELEVIYQAASQASWDQSPDWFPAQHGYRARHLRPLHLARRGRSPVTWPRGLEAALSALDPDVVVVSEFGPATLRCLTWCRARRRALVVLTEVTGEGERGLSRLQRFVHRMLARRVDGSIAVSTAARTRLLGLGADPASVTVSLQPVQEAALLAAVQTRRPVDREPVELLSVARLVPDKELGTLIAAFAEAGVAGACTQSGATIGSGSGSSSGSGSGRVDGAGAGASLRLVGGGPLEAELRALAAERALPVGFSGAIGSEELPGLYAHASVFVLPSRYEPFGVALREAVVAGLPVICSTAVGAAADFARDGENAILFAPGDRAALSRALQKVCGDPALRRRMGAASSRVARERSLQLDVEAFAAAISSAAQAARARR